MLDNQRRCRCLNADPTNAEAQTGRPVSFLPDTAGALFPGVFCRSFCQAFLPGVFAGALLEGETNGHMLRFVERYRRRC